MLKTAFSRRAIALPFLSALVLMFFASPRVRAQEVYVVGLDTGGADVLRLSNSTETQWINGSSASGVACGANPRLAFTITGSQISVMDLTGSVGSVIRQIHNVRPSSNMAFTSDGKYLLVVGNNKLLFIDAGRLVVVGGVKLGQVLRNGLDSAGSIVVVGQKAYVLPQTPDPLSQAVAVVDLRSRKVKPIRVPIARFDGKPSSPNAAATPDGKYVIMIGTSADSSTNYMTYIDTASDRVAFSKTFSFTPAAITVTPVTDSAQAFGYVVQSGVGTMGAYVIDLRENVNNMKNPNFGQQLQGSLFVSLSAIGNIPTGAAVNGDGSRLVVTSHLGNPTAPQPNAAVMDTGIMQSGNGMPILNEPIIRNGATPNGVAITPLTSGTHPLITGGPGPIVNNQPNAVQFTGSNFAAGALVKVGAMNPIPADSVAPDGTQLSVTIPAGAPAGNNLGVIVTNPNLTMPLDQQNQSGFWQQGLTISPTTVFQPQKQFAVLNTGSNTVSLYQLNQGSLFDLSAGAPRYHLGTAFNTAGSRLVALVTGLPYNSTHQLVAWKSSDGSFDRGVILPFGPLPQFRDMVITANPISTTSTSAAYIAYTPFGTDDVALAMVDVDPNSGSYMNTPTTFLAGLPGGDVRTLSTLTATPDGKYVYVAYLDVTLGQTNVTVFDIVNHVVNTFSVDIMGTSFSPYSLTVSPDGKYLLGAFNATNQAYGFIAVGDLTTKNGPLQPKLIATIPAKQAAYFTSFQVFNSKLFAFDQIRGIAMAFNFDPNNMNFAELASYPLPPGVVYGIYFGMTPDGAYLYVPARSASQIVVLDANALANNQPAFVTNVASTWAPNEVVVQP